MNIALIVRRLNVRGGTQRMVAELAGELRRGGHAVTIYTFFYDKEVCYPELFKNFPVVTPDSGHAEQFRRHSIKRGLFSFFRTAFNENRLARNLAHKISPDTDILNPHDQVVYKVAYYFKKEIKSVPSVWMMNDTATKKHSDIRTQEMDPTFHISYIKKKIHALVDWYEARRFVSSQDAIAVLDTRDREWAYKEYGIPTVVVRNGLDVQEFPFVAHEGITGKHITLLTMGILMPHRRFEDSIEAVALLCKKGFDASLSIAGGGLDGPYHAKLQALIEQLDLGDRVHFLGQCTREQVLQKYHDADIFLFVSHLQSWGLAVFEAMSAGLPVIVSETAGASEVLEQGKTAMLVPPYSSEKIADAVGQLADPAVYQRIAKNGRAFVEAHISWERYAKELLEMFLEARKLYL